MSEEYDLEKKTISISSDLANLEKYPYV